MTKIVLDKCLDVTEAGVEVHVSPRDSNTPTYWVQAFWTQSDTLKPIKADAIKLGEEDECRVVFWEGVEAPKEMPRLKGPGGDDPSIIWAFGPDGSATVIDNLKDEDPWPRRTSKKSASKKMPPKRPGKKKPAAKKAKPVARKSKPAARKVKKPAAKKAAPRKAVAKKKAPTKKKAARPSRRR